MKIIMIHGRDQHGKDPAELREIWLETFDKGLQSGSYTLPDKTKVLFPYYGDLLDSLVKSPDVPSTVEGIIARGVTVGNELFFFYDFIIELAEKKNITTKDIDKNYTGEYKEKGPLNWEWVQAIMKTIDERTTFGDWSIEKFTRDVFLYLTIPGIRKAINDFVCSAFDSQPTIVIAHSLGTIVAYNVLKDNPSWNIKKFITIGSPLGLKSIKSKLDTPLVMPRCIKNGWFNAYDERDFVSLNPLDIKYFNITPPIINKNNVNNFTENRHGIIGYLNDKEIVKVIYNELIS